MIVGFPSLLNRCFVRPCGTCLFTFCLLGSCFSGHFLDVACPMAGVPSLGTVCCPLWVLLCKPVLPVWFRCPIALTLGVNDLFVCFLFYFYFFSILPFFQKRM
jgi:hypothetical protein